MPKVYEGSAELNIQPFLDALKTMETAAGQTAINVVQQLQQLDQGIQTALQGAQAQINAVATQINTIGQALNGANAQMKQGQQALQQQAQQANQQAQQSNAQAGQIRQAYLQASQADQQRELAALRAAGNDKAALRQSQSQLDLAALRRATENETQEIQQRYAAQNAVLKQAIDQQRQLQQQYLRDAANAKNQQAQNLTSGDLGKAEAAEQSYRAAIAAAKQAAETETSLQRQLTSTMQVERTAQSHILDQALAKQVEAAKQANREFVGGWKEAWKQAVEDFQEKMGVVEARWGQVFRAGGQLQSIGTQMTAISGSLGLLGGKLTENAGTFDFWSRRTVAAAQSANKDLFAVFGGDQQETLAAFNDKILKLGRDLGTLKPEEVAQSWFMYQAAVGETITTQDDLIKGQVALDAILKAAIVSDTGFETAIRGVTQAMAEFGLGQEQAAHATSVMLNLTQASQSEFTDVLESFKMVGPQAGRLGMTLEETSAIISRLSDTGIRGSSAGRSLSMALTTILDPSDKATEALQKLLVANQGLSGSWQDIVFKGGEFIGMLDSVDAATGETTKGFLHTFAEATKGMSEAERQRQLAMVFSQNATRALIPLVGEYADAMANGNAQTATGKKRMEELAAEFENAQLQAQLFAGQWRLVSDGIKIQMGQATFTLREVFVRLGNIVAPIFISILGWVGKAALAFSLFAEKHPALSRGFVMTAAAVAVLTGVLGPLLIFFGAILKTVATIPVTLTAIQGSLGVLAVPLKALGVGLGALVAPALAVIAVIGALYLAWKTNFLGMGQTLEGFFGNLKTEFAALADILSGVMELIEGLLEGNADKVKAAISTIGIAVVEAFAVIPQLLVGALTDVGSTLIDWVNTTFSGLSDNMGAWGENLMYSLTDGILTAASAVFDAVWGIAEGIAQFFRSFSPPKHGPLMGIFKWGNNLIGTLIEGMQSADLEAVTEIAGKIGDALMTNIKYTGGDANVYAETMTTANAKVAEMIGIIKEGGTVSADFFTPLADGLGEWYEDVVKIALAYQDVYAAQNALNVEKEKLELLKQQSKELDAQAKARNLAFDKALGQTDPNNANSQFAQEEMVDPTTAEGQAKIEQMRRSLSKEDFQNWINWQKKLWDQRHDAEKDALDIQAEAEQAAVDAAQKQLDLTKAQYDTYVKMFEYAQRLLQLQEEEDRLKEKDKAAGASSGTYGSPEQLAAARGEIAGVVGADGALLDEGTLRSNRGGDDVGALGDATRQREAEQARITDLDALNRKKRADFEAQLINASSDAERQTIKEQKDAWDAAYKEEKARLTERLQFAKEIQDAAENQADRSKAAREAEKQAQFERDIANLMGEQSRAITDANTLKGQSKDLDEAALKAQGQLRDEERKLSDLKALGDQKALTFKERLRLASGDPEATRRIKEEQEAWETAYKRAVEVQQARVEMARRAKQDIGDEAQDERAAKKPEFGGIGGGGGPPIIDPALAQKNQDILDEYKRKLKALQDAQREQGQETDKQRPTQERAGEIWKRIVGIYHDMTNSSLSLETRMQALGIIIGKEIVGPFAAWADQTFGLSQTFGPLIAMVGDLWGRLTGGKDIFAGLTAGWNKLISDLGIGNITWQGLKQAVIDLWTEFDRGNGWTTGMSRLWNEVLLPAINAVASFVKTEVVPLLGDAPQVALDSLGYGLGLLGDIWKNILLPAVYLVWAFFRDAVLPQIGLITAVTIPLLKGAVEVLGWVWSNVLWPALELVWKFFRDNMLPIFKLFTEVGMLVLEAAVKGLAAAWDTVLGPALKTFFGWVQDTAMPKLKELGDYLSVTLRPFVNGIASAFEAVYKAISDAIDKVGEFLDKARDMIAAWKEWLGLGSSKPKDGGSPPKAEPKVDGSNADGLGYVPFDGYISELHKGERVLTAAEAKLYNSVEKGGMLAVMNTLAGATTARVAQATAPKPVNQNTTNIKEGDRKSVNFGDVHIDASNPDEGRAFLQKLAFLT